MSQVRKNRFRTTTVKGLKVVSRGGKTNTTQGAQKKKTK